MSDDPDIAEWEAAHTKAIDPDIAEWQAAHNVKSSSTSFNLDQYGNSDSWQKELLAATNTHKLPVVPGMEDQGYIPATIASNLAGGVKDLGGTIDLMQGGSGLANGMGEAFDTLTGVPDSTDINSKSFVGRTARVIPSLALGGEGPVLTAVRSGVSALGGIVGDKIGGPVGDSLLTIVGGAAPEIASPVTGRLASSFGKAAEATRPLSELEQIKADLKIKGGQVAKAGEYKLPGPEGEHPIVQSLNGAEQRGLFAGENDPASLVEKNKQIIGDLNAQVHGIKDENGDIIPGLIQQADAAIKDVPKIQLSNTSKFLSGLRDSERIDLKNQLQRAASDIEKGFDGSLESVSRLKSQFQADNYTGTRINDSKALDQAIASDLRKTIIDEANKADPGLGDKINDLNHQASEQHSLTPILEKANNEAVAKSLNRENVSSANFFQSPWNSIKNTASSIFSRPIDTAVSKSLGGLSDIFGSLKPSLFSRYGTVSEASSVLPEKVQALLSGKDSQLALPGSDSHLRLPSSPGFSMRDPTLADLLRQPSITGESKLAIEAPKGMHYGEDFTARDIAPYSSLPNDSVKTSLPTPQILQAGNRAVDPRLVKSSREVPEPFIEVPLESNPRTKQFQGSLKNQLDASKSLVDKLRSSAGLILPKKFSYAAPLALGLAIDELKVKSSTPITPKSLSNALDNLKGNKVSQSAVNDSGVNASSVSDSSIIPPSLKLAQRAQESGGLKDPANAVSPKGAIGLYQIEPKTAADIAQKLGLKEGEYDLRDPKTNEAFYDQYMGDLLTQFKDPQLALAAYNAGQGKVKQWQQEYGKSWSDIAPKLEAKNIYSETTKYVSNISKKSNLV